MSEPTPPTREEIESCAHIIQAHVVRTPCVPCVGRKVLANLDAEVHMKLELLQRTGSFKPRGALAVMLSLTEAEKAAGVTAFSFARRSRQTRLLERK